MPLDLNYQNGFVPNFFTGACFVAAPTFIIPHWVLVTAPHPQIRKNGPPLRAQPFPPTHNIQRVCLSISARVTSEASGILIRAIILLACYVRRSPLCNIVKSAVCTQRTNAISMTAAVYGMWRGCLLACRGEIRAGFLEICRFRAGREVGGRSRSR